MIYSEHSFAQARTFSANTLGVSAREKVNYWREAVFDRVAELDFRPVGTDSFDASVVGSKMADLTISRIEGSAHAAIHSVSGLKPSQDRLVFNFVLTGQMLTEQDGRTVVVKAGDGAVCDAARPYVVQFDKPFEIACIALQRDRFPQRSANLVHLTAKSFLATSELCPIVMSYLLGLMKQAPALTPLNSDLVSRNFIELLSSMVVESTNCAQSLLSGHRGMVLVRVKDFIEQNLNNADLDSARVAWELKLSPRYINQLLEAEGTSLSRYIWRRRLERASADLQNPAYRNQSVSTIAMSNGFNDLSHFSKAFRLKFNQSPRQFRA